MADNVIGLFDSESVADRVVADLTEHGFNRGDITRLEGSREDLAVEMEREGIPESDAAYYVDRLMQGGVLVSVRAQGDQVEEAVEIMNRHAGTEETEFAGAADDMAPDSVTYDAVETETVEVTGLSAADTEPVVPATAADNARLEVVEERLQIGKREVQRGGVRVRRVVSERAVEEQVTLRDETIHVDRRPVDRTLDRNAPDLFTEQTYEFTETDEEAVIAKEARVVEEVVVGKDVEERTETVRDTVRRADVEVDEIAATDVSSDASDPSYLYAQTLATDARYTGREWVDIEAEARRDWEAKNQGGSWDEARGSVRSAWDRLRARG